MSITLAIMLTSLLSAGTARSVDTTTGLTHSKQHALEEAIAIRRAKLANNIDVSISRTELEYQSVCPECFKYGLACGKLEPYAEHYACMSESMDSLGVDETSDVDSHTEGVDQH